MPKMVVARPAGHWAAPLSRCPPHEGPHKSRSRQLQVARHQRLLCGPYADWNRFAKAIALQQEPAVPVRSVLSMMAILDAARSGTSKIVIDPAIWVGG